MSALTDLRKDYERLRAEARQVFEGRVEDERMKFNDRLVALRREYERCLAQIPPAVKKAEQGRRGVRG